MACCGHVVDSGCPKPRHMGPAWQPGLCRHKLLVLQGYGQHAPPQHLRHNNVCAWLLLLPLLLQGFATIYEGHGEGPPTAKDRTHFTLKPLGPGQKYSFRIRVGVVCLVACQQQRIMARHV